MYVFGDNEFGQLGIGQLPLPFLTFPTPMLDDATESPLTRLRIVSIAAGACHSAVLTGTRTSCI